MSISGYEALLVHQCRAVGLPKPSTELQFAKPRRWRFDVAFEAQRLAVEVEGATWANGRHTRGQGFENDCLKYAEAVIRGWRVLRVTSNMVKDGRALGLIERALAVMS